MSIDSTHGKHRNFINSVDPKASVGNFKKFSLSLASLIKMKSGQSPLMFTQTSKENLSNLEPG